MMALERLVGKLDRLSPLSPEDKSALMALPLEIERVPRRKRLVREGEIPDRCCLLFAGYACRSKLGSNGARQIVSFHIPGDILDIQHILLPRADHDVQTITEAEVAWIRRAELIRLSKDHPAIGHALWRDSLIDASIFREWVMNVGRRDARSRIAHMLCEFTARCEAIGLGNADMFDLPMTQEEIGDATGLTSVHVNRTLKTLEHQGAIRRSGRSVLITDGRLLRSIGDFDASYLHQAA